MVMILLFSSDNKPYVGYTQLQPIERSDNFTVLL